MIFRKMVGIVLLFCLGASMGEAVLLYDSPSPIHLTVAVDDYVAKDEANRRKKVNDSFNFMAVAIYEMSRGMHRLGKVRVVKSAREYLHINYLEEHPGTGALSQAATYLPYGQNAIGANRINIGYKNFQGYSNTLGYTLGHEAGHFIYGMFDEYEGKSILPIPWHNPWMFDDGLAVKPTVMQSQEDATFDSDLQALAFSTLFNYFWLLAIRSGWFIKGYRYDIFGPL